MENSKDPFQLKKNLLALAVFILIILVAVDVLLRLQPGIVTGESAKEAISAVGHYHEFEDGTSYYIYTIFHSNGDVYRCWYDGDNWNQKVVTNYKGLTTHPGGQR